MKWFEKRNRDKERENWDNCNIPDPHLIFYNSDHKTEEYIPKLYKYLQQFIINCFLPFKPIRNNICWLCMCSSFI